MELTSSKEPSECRRERVAWVGESDIPMLESAVTCFVCWAGAAQQLRGRSIKDSNTIKSIFLLSFCFSAEPNKKVQRSALAKRERRRHQCLCSRYLKNTPDFPRKNE
jgi:hypothetical protein